MQKFFRKHMRKLLMVFMTLLLITWLGGSAPARASPLHLSVVLRI